MNLRTIVLPLTAMLSVGVIAACGDDETTSQTSDASATTETGSFAVVRDAPEGFDDVSGTATLVRDDGGTDASIQLAGLKPNVKYASHVHAEACDQADPGGPHFKFDPDGGDTPPNEIHLPFESDAQGNGSAKAHNDSTVPVGEGRSIVVHVAAAKDNAAGGTHSNGNSHSQAKKIACASLDADGQSDSAAAAPTPTKTSTAPKKTSEDKGGLAIGVKDGKPVGAIKSLTVKKGEKVRFTVTSDTTQEIHAHAYDISEEAGPGKPATFDFTASIEGIFEVEVEGTGEQILKLTVNP